MIIDATFWVAVSFLIFIGVLVYLKVPQKIDNSLNEIIKKIKGDLDNAEKLKDQAKTLLSEYETKVSKSKDEVNNLISKTKNETEIVEVRNKNAGQTEKKPKPSKDSPSSVSSNEANELIQTGVEDKTMASNSVDDNLEKQPKRRGWWRKTTE